MLPQAATTAIDALFNDYRKRDTPGYVVGVAREGRLIFSRAYGMADLDHRIPLTSSTSFHLASLSKQFTAAAAALLITDGKLALDDPVARWVPETAKFGPELRVEHLVYFSSGLPEYWSIPRPGGQPWHSFHLFDNEDMFRSILTAERLDFVPGAKWRYSNSDYLMLAKVVEAAAGTSLAALLQRRIFAPLEMSGAQVNDDPTLIIANRATGYVERSAMLVHEGRKVDVPIRAGQGWARLPRVSPHYGGSGVFASLEDLVKWDRNWYQSKLGRGFAALMHRHPRFSHGKNNDGFGLVRDDQFGKETWAYAGSDLDTSTYMARFPAKRVTVICLSNMPTGRADGKCREVLKILNDVGQL
jgi:CubicO group peptidase (beta-lactamase class C family)